MDGSVKLSSWSCPYHIGTIHQESYA
uniref:Uncharacterized protein n=1 Tax=Arundo donax TaxID=35708 RepID=A0A0A9C2G3_ARUDO